MKKLIESLQAVRTGTKPRSIQPPEVVAEESPPRHPVTTWKELQAELESDRNDR